MRAVPLCILALLPMALGGAGCAAPGNDYAAVAAVDAVDAGATEAARPASYVTYTSTPYYGGYRPYYTYAGALRGHLYSKPYYYRDHYPSPRLYRAPGYRTFGRYSYYPWNRYDSRRFDPHERDNRYPFDHKSYDRRFSRRYDDRYDRRFSQRYYDWRDRGGVRHWRHDSPRRHTYSPRGDRFHFRGDHFRDGGSRSGSITPRSGRR